MGALVISHAVIFYLGGCLAMVPMARAVSHDGGPKAALFVTLGWWLVLLAIATGHVRWRGGKDEA